MSTFLSVLMWWLVAAIFALSRWHTEFGSLRDCPVWAFILMSPPAAVVALIMNPPRSMEGGV